MLCAEAIDVVIIYVKQGRGMYIYIYIYMGSDEEKADHLRIQGGGGVYIGVASTHHIYTMKSNI